MAGPSLVVQVGANISGLREEMTKAGATLLTFQDRADQAGGRLMDLGVRSDGAAPKVGTLGSSMHAFDGVLSAVGIHIGPEIKAIEELSAAAGKTAGSLGLLSSAGLVVGAAFVGWKIGRAIADVTGLDKPVQTVWERLLNLSDAGERAAAVTDTLALASRNAGHAITDYSEAIKINAAAAEHLALVRGRSADAAHDSLVQEAALQKELRDARSRGDIPALTHDLDLHILTHQQLSVKYGLTVTAIGYFIDKLKDTEEATKKADAAQKELAKGWADFYDWAADEEAKRDAQITKDVQHQFDVWRTAEKAREQEAAAIEANREQTNRLLGQAAMDVAVAEEKERFAAQAANEEHAKVPAVTKAAADGLLSVGAAAQQSTSFLAGMSAELYNAIRAAQAADAPFNKDRQSSSLISGIQPRAAGGPVSAGSPYLVGERGAELFVPGASGSIVPHGAGAASSVVVNLYVSGAIGSPQDVGRMLKKQFVDALRSEGVRLPVMA